MSMNTTLPSVGTTLPPGTSSHPWTILGAQIVLMSLTLGFTKPSSLIRAANLIPMLLVTVVYIPTARYRIDNIFRVSWGASHSILTTYQYINVALLNRWDFDFSGPQPKEPTKKSTSPYGKDTFWNRVKFGFYAASSFRHCGTPFETRGLQPFKRDDPSFVPSTGRFLFAGAIHLVTCYLALDALTSLGDPDKVADLFGEHRIPLLSRLGEVTFQELVERFTCAFAFWLVNYLILSVAGTVLSLFTVATGMAGVIWWKPMFNFGNGFPFTVRRFWSHFWHLTVKNRILDPSTFIVDKVLKLRRGSLVSRYLTLTLTFVFSMAFHWLGDIASGIPPHKSGAPVFFMAQAGAIIIEDLVQYIWTHVFASEHPTQKGPAQWQVWLGRAWVLAFMFWCTPFYAFPVTAHNGDGLIVPFSIMRHIFAPRGVA